MRLAGTATSGGVCGRRGPRPLCGRPHARPARTARPRAGAQRDGPGEGAGLSEAGLLGLSDRADGAPWGPDGGSVGGSSASGGGGGTPAAASAGGSLDGSTLDTLDALDTLSALSSGEGEGEVEENPYRPEDALRWVGWGPEGGDGLRTMASQGAGAVACAACAFAPGHKGRQPAAGRSPAACDACRLLPPRPTPVRPTAAAPAPRAPRRRPRPTRAAPRSRRCSRPRRAASP
jgi:hypothetical protein